MNTFQKLFKLPLGLLMRLHKQVGFFGLDNLTSVTATGSLTFERPTDEYGGKRQIVVTLKPKSTEIHTYGYDSGGICCFEQHDIVERVLALSAMADAKAFLYGS